MGLVEQRSELYTKAMSYDIYFSWGCLGDPHVQVPSIHSKFQNVICGVRSNGLKFEQFIEAAYAVAKRVSKEDLENGWLYPPLTSIRDVAAHVAQAVAQKSYESGMATNLPKPKWLLDYARQYMYVPRYKFYR